MSLQASVGLRNGMLAGSPLKAALDTGCIMIFGGTKPTQPDDAIGSATLLTTIKVSATDSTNGNGITMATPAVNGVLSKNPSEMWAGMNVASGNATFYRHVGPNDDGLSSSSEPRLQGNVGVSGSDLNLTAGTSLVINVSTPIDTYTIELPAGG